MSDPPSPPTKPSLGAIFKVFFVIGCIAFGGGASAHIHHAVVHRKKWLDDVRMLEGMTVARIVPGTNVSNLAAFVGALLGGYRGAALAVAGVVVPGLVAIVALAVAYTSFAEHSELLRPALHGLTAGAVGIMASLVLNHAKPLLKSYGGLLVAVLAFVGVAVLELNMLLVLVVLTPVASFLNKSEEASERQRG
jgi:chromate transporter